MTTLQFNFADPNDLLEQLSNFREHLNYEQDLEFFTTEMTKNIEKLKIQRELKAPIDLEITQLRSRQESGFIDRFKYRELSRGVRQKQSEIDEKIHKLQTDNDQFATKIYQLKKLFEPAREYLNTFKSLVVTYSIVTVSQNGKVSSYMLVPDALRQVCSESDVVLLATNSGLGAAILNQRIGKVDSPKNKFGDLEILHTDLADNATLEYLSDVYLSTQQAGGYQFVKHVGNEESFRRWGFKGQNNYIQCTKCRSMYPPGSLCKCHS
jgi:hypothetical protein